MRNSSLPVPALPFRPHRCVRYIIEPTPPMSRRCARRADRRSTDRGADELPPDRFRERAAGEHRAAGRARVHDSALRRRSSDQDPPCAGHAVAATGRAGPICSHRGQRTQRARFPHRVHDRGVGARRSRGLFPHHLEGHGIRSAHPLRPRAAHRGAAQRCDCRDSPAEATEREERLERLASIVQNLTAHGNARPRKITTLANSINNLFRKSLSEVEIAGLIAALQQAGHINIDGQSVHYRL